MPAPKIRCDYDQLGQIVGQLSAQASATQQILRSLRAQVEALQNGDWVGQGAQAFYREMSEQVLPSLERLQRALSQSASVTRQINTLIRQAEEESAQALRRFDPAFSGLAFSSQPGAGDDAAGGADVGAGGLAGKLSDKQAPMWAASEGMAGGKLGTSQKVGELQFKDMQAKVESPAELAGKKWLGEKWLGENTPIGDKDLGTPAAGEAVAGKFAEAAGKIEYKIQDGKLIFDPASQAEQKVAPSGDFAKVAGQVDDKDLAGGAFTEAAGKLGYKITTPLDQAGAKVSGKHLPAEFEIGAEVLDKAGPTAAKLEFKNAPAGYKISAEPDLSGSLATDKAAGDLEFKDGPAGSLEV
jgi:WXG100 family type VII secretion target